MQKTQERFSVTLRVMRVFSVSRQLLLRCSTYAHPWARPCTPISYMSFPRPTDVSRMIGYLHTHSESVGDALVSSRSDECINGCTLKDAENKGIVHAALDL